MRVLLIGSGAREHAIAWKLLQSSVLTELLVAPGNAGTGLIATNIPLAIPKPDAWSKVREKFKDDVVALCRKHRIDFVVIGPEAPLAYGVVDRLAKERILAFGPTQAAAQIEASKIWAHEFMERHTIPHPSGKAFYSIRDARRWLVGDKPSVIKADRLAAGKGVVVAENRRQALQGLIDLGEKYGQAFLIQELLSGREVSAHAFTDGEHLIHMPFSCDYKKSGEGNTGENTGGIGCYSPVVWLEEAAEHFIRQYITKVSVRSLRDGGIQYKGVLYPGLMITDEGPKVLEFNCRFGDPEAQVLLPRLKADLLKIMLACVEVEGELLNVSVEWDERACVCVVLFSGGYPGDYEIGFSITGLDRIPEDVLVFHAGTRQSEDGQILTDGGRVLSVVALGETIEEARQKVYAAIELIQFQGMDCRSDIALV